MIKIKKRGAAVICNGDCTNPTCFNSWVTSNIQMSGEPEISAMMYDYQPSELM